MIHHFDPLYPRHASGPVPVVTPPALLRPRVCEVMLAASPVAAFGWLLVAA